MPELPDITLYLEALASRVLNHVLKDVRVLSPFLLRTATPPLESVRGRKLVKLRRLGKRLALGFEADLWLVIHLMIAGRLHWIASEPAATQAPPGTPRLMKTTAQARKMAAKQALFDFDCGQLILTEAGTKRRASLHLVQGEAALRALNPNGLEVLGCSVDDFSRALTAQRHTLKRALTDPRLFSGIGNAYSDEILHRSRLSPVTLTQRLLPEEIERLRRATQDTLNWWVEHLRAESVHSFPENVTAFRPEMAVHGKYGQPCPVCGTKVQRIRYADNETNYCPKCQTKGKLLADRSLSLLLKKDWPKTLAELEEMRTERK